MVLSVLAVHPPDRIAEWKLQRLPLPASRESTCLMSLVQEKVRSQSLKGGFCGMRIAFTPW